MKIETAEVNMRDGNETKKIGTVDFPEYDTVDEAVENYGESKCLEAINATIRTNAMNKKRAEVRDGPGKKALAEKAMAALSEEDWKTIATASAADRPAILTRLVEAKVAELRAAILETPNN